MWEFLFGKDRPKTRKCKILNLIGGVIVIIIIWRNFT